jgi:hypothetical protein
MLPKNPSERYLLLVIFPMFLLGVAMLYLEIVKWRQKRRELYGEAPGRLPLSEKLRSIRERFQPSVKSTENDQTKNAAGGPLSRKQSLSRERAGLD